MTREEINKKLEEVKLITDPLYKELREINSKEKKDKLTKELVELAKSKSFVYLKSIEENETYITIGFLKLDFDEEDILIENGYSIKYREEGDQDEYSIIFEFPRELWHFELTSEIKYTIIDNRNSIIKEFYHQYNKLNKFLNKNN